MIICFSGDPKSIDPIYATDVRSGKLCALLYDNLVQFDKSINIIPGIAYKWEKNNSGKEYKFYIKDKIIFNNGVPLNSNLVIKSFERVTDKYLYKNISNIETTSDSTITFKLFNPEPSFLSKLAMPIASIIYLDQDSLIYGTGPWILNEWIKDGQIILDRNNNYFSTLPNFNKIIIRIISDPFPKVASFTSGYLDIIDIPDSEKKIWNQDIEFAPLVKTVNELNTYYIGLNCDRKPFNNKYVRQAMNYAIDIDKIILKLKDGYATRAIGPIPPELQNIKNKQLYLYNQNKAKELLKNAGYENGFSIELWQTQDSEILNISEIIQAELKKINIEVIIITRDWNSLSSAIRDGIPDMYYRSWYADYPDPENFLSPLFESSISKMKWNRYSNNNLDSLMNLINIEMDPQIRNELVFDANSILINDAPWIFLWHETNSYISQPWIKKWDPPVMFNAEKYLDIYYDKINN